MKIPFLPCFPWIDYPSPPWMCRKKTTRKPECEVNGCLSPLGLSSLSLKNFLSAKLGCYLYPMFSYLRSNVCGWKPPPLKTVSASAWRYAPPQSSVGNCFNTGSHRKAIELLQLLWGILCVPNSLGKKDAVGLSSLFFFSCSRALCFLIQKRKWKGVDT